MKILVIGDSCEDVFVKGSVDRLCPEAPVPVINPKNTTSNPGMAANVVANLRSLRPDAEVYFLTQDSVIKKIRYVDETSGYILLRVDEGDATKTPLEFSTLEEFLKINGLTIDYFDAVIISDYNKGFLTEEFIHKLGLLLIVKPILSFLDTKKVLGKWSQLINFVKINLKEYELQKQHCVSPWTFCVTDLIVTLGKDGSKSIKSDVTIPTEPVNVMDVSGAGDTYLAAFAIKYMETHDKYTAMKYANKAAGIAVSNHGVVAVKQSEIEGT